MTRPRKFSPERLPSTPSIDGLLTVDEERLLRALDGTAKPELVRNIKVLLADVHQRLVNEIDQRTRTQAMLAGEMRVLELIATGAAVDEVLEVICSSVEEHCNDVRCMIRMAGDRGQTDPPKDFGNRQLFNLPPEFPRDDSDRRESLDESRLREWKNAAHIMALHTEMITGGAGQHFGTVIMGYPTSRWPHEDEIEAGMAAARLAVIAIEKSRAEEQVRRQLAELAHVGRLSTMGEMASGLAHELNQPLCAIVNYAEACMELIARNTPEGQLRAPLEQVARQAERAGEVIRRLRDFVRRQEPHRSALDINQLVREVLALMRAESRQREVNITLKMASRTPKASADSIQIQQVLVNLIRNAMDAMEQLPSSQRKIEISTRRSGAFLEIIVKDWGHGIHHETTKRLFESFYTTKKSGMGMGLSISRSIIEMHDGRIWAAAQQPVGTAFHFTLPLARRSSDGSAKRHRIRR